MARRMLVIFGLIVAASLTALVVYMVLFGVAFSINDTYFPETREYHRMFAPAIIAMTWVASFSSISLAYVLYRNRKEHK